MRIYLILKIVCEKVLFSGFSAWKIVERSGKIWKNMECSLYLSCSVKLNKVFLVNMENNFIGLRDYFLLVGKSGFRTAAPAKFSKKLKILRKIIKLLKKYKKSTATNLTICKKKVIIT